MPIGFISFCETLWQDWLADRLETSPFVRRAFDLDAAPEPYVLFGSGQSPVLLTTNPGGTMPHQQRTAVQAGGGPLSPAIDYATAANALGAFYQRELAHRPAGCRIAAMRELCSALIGAEDYVQVDVCPFHSPSLPNKVGLLRETSTGGLLTRYVEEVRAFLVARPVVAVSAARPLISMGSEMPLSPWQMWISGVAGLDPNRAEFVPLVTKGQKVTSMALVSSHDGVPKALVLMMGGNRLPGEHGRGLLAEVLRRHFRQAG